MGAKVATTSFHWSKPSVSSSPSLKRCQFSDGALMLRAVDRSALFGTRVHRSRSCEPLKSRTQTIKRSYSATASLDAFSDEEFSKKMEELTSRFKFRNHEDQNPESDAFPDSIFSHENSNRGGINFPARWPEQKENIPANIEWKANSSIKKAFSSMVFIIRELQSFTLQMREFLFFEDLQGILTRVHKEMHASFVWLFQRVFSSTPTLMVYVMILLANYSVHSMSSNTAFAVAPPAPAQSASIGESEIQHIFGSVCSSTGKATSIGGNNGGGGNSRPVSSGTDGEGSGSPASMDFHRTASNPTYSGEEESVSGQVAGEESSVTAKMEAGDKEEYLRTEIVYKKSIAQDPNNPLLLANYAQFLYLVAKENDRAEEYFKRAVKSEPQDAEALSKYANFLWEARNDLWSAEETFLEAISADPSNSFYAANYAHFLWNTGGDDTCFPISE